MHVTEMFYIRRLVLLLNILLLASAENQNTGKFLALRSENGSALCAMSTPDCKIFVRSKLDCYGNCMFAGCACKNGANYRQIEKLCELFSALPVEYRVVSNCAFYQVDLRFQLLCDTASFTSRLLLR